LNGRAQKSFSIKETIFAGFASLLTQRRAASHPQSAFGGQSRRAGGGKAFPQFLWQEEGKTEKFSFP